MGYIVWDAALGRDPMYSTVMNRGRGTVTGSGMYQKLIVFIQALAAVGILVIAVITWIGQSTSELRIEMKEEFRSVRSEMQDMNKRLGRVEGEVRALT